MRRKGGARVGRKLKELIRRVEEGPYRWVGELFLMASLLLAAFLAFFVGIVIWMMSIEVYSVVS